MPDWRQVTRSIAAKVGIDPDIFERQIQQESGFNPDARSPAGAQGIAQIVPSAHPNVDPMNPVEALTYAANWMKSLVRQYGGDYRLALAAYNAGPGAVAKYGGVPPFEETARYLNVILGPANAEAAELSDAEVQQMVQSGQATPTSTATAMSGQGMTPDAFRALATKHGGVAGHQILDMPTKGAVDPYGEPTGEKEPLTVNPRVRYTFKDGTHVVARQRDDGQYEIVDAGTALKNGAAGTTPVDSLEQIRDPNTGRVVKLRDPQTGAIIDLPDQRSADTGPQIITIGGRPYQVETTPNYPGDLQGSVRLVPVPGLPPSEQKSPERITIGRTVYERDPTTGTWKPALTADRDPLDTAATQAQARASNASAARTEALTPLEVAKAQQDLLPRQQQIIQGQIDTIKFVQGMLERGEIDQATANAYINSSRSAAEAALAGTTPFDIQKEQRQAADAQRTAGISLLNQRLSSGNSLASSLVASVLGAAQNATFKPGQTSLGLDPLALASAFTNQMGGGPAMGQFAQNLITGAGAGTAPPAPAGPPQPVAVTPGGMPPDAQPIPPPPWLMPQMRMPGAPNAPPNTTPVAA